MTRRETTRQAKMTAAAQTGKEYAGPPGPGWRTVVLRVAGAGLLIAAGAIHLDLYLTGYRTIPVIGWLFLLQVPLGVAEAGAGPRASAGTGLKTTTIGGTTVLTNARGFTVYWFAPDTPATSTCYGGCATYWPPVTGTTAASPGLPGRVGTITRTDGSRQLTYNGHPLYTYIGDTTPGQARGNDLNLNGGLWHEVRVSG
jgi:predicted lipoprotein with Yx(FWY)xxD motif